MCAWRSSGPGQAFPSLMVIAFCNAMFSNDLQFLSPKTDSAIPTNLRHFPMQVALRSTRLVCFRDGHARVAAAELKRQDPGWVVVASPARVVASLSNFLAVDSRVVRGTASVQVACAHQLQMP